MGSNVKLNKYGFYEAAEKPNQAELEKYYAEKYYQTAQGSYENEYPTAEYEYFDNKIEQKIFVINKLFSKKENNSRTLIDIGCGEGFTLNHFKKKGWKVTGLDYSEFGVKKFNPDCLPDLITGDIYKQMEPIIADKIQFDVVWLDNLLEHVIDPLFLLQQCKKLLKPDGVLVIEVPNDFSVLHQHLIKNNYINNEFWVVIPDHLSYFNKSGLEAIAADAGFKTEFVIGDYPIDFSLMNPDTNYNKDKTKGKNAHRTRVEMENLIHSISVEHAVNYFKALADMGLGRQIVTFLKHK